MWQACCSLEVEGAIATGHQKITFKRHEGGAASLMMQWHCSYLQLASLLLLAQLGGRVLQRLLLRLLLLEERLVLQRPVQPAETASDGAESSEQTLRTSATWWKSRTMFRRTLRTNLFRVLLGTRLCGLQRLSLQIGIQKRTLTHAALNQLWLAIVCSRSKSGKHGTMRTFPPSFCKNSHRKHSNAAKSVM